MAALKDSIDGCLNSKRVNASNIPGVKYFLSVFPNGHCVDRRGKVMIFLYVDVGKESRVKADGKFHIESAGWTEKLNHEYLRTKGSGFSPCKTVDFFDSKQKFIVNGELIVTFEGKLIVNKEKAENGNENKSVTGQLGSLFWMNEDKDFTINVGENAVKVSFNFTLNTDILYS